MNTVLIIGAKSDIAKALARAYAANHSNLQLAARKVHELETFANDLRIRHRIDVSLYELDITATASHQSFYETVTPKPQGVIVASGYMCEQEAAQTSLEKTLQTLNVNFTGAVCLLNIVANDFEARQEGFIVGISSVAGDRGRASNYIYGAAKAGFSAYLSGLRNRLYASGVHVMSVKPGFVNTKMTAALRLSAPLTAQPDEVAEDILNAQQRNVDILYTKGIWRYIMGVITLIPESLFKKMHL